MNVSATILAQAVQLGVITPEIYLPDAIRAIKERYGFVGVPTGATEILVPANGPPLTFSHGKLVHEAGTILIRAFKIFPRGFVVETASSTDDSDRVIDDLAAWAPDALSIRLALQSFRSYASQLEVWLDRPLGLFFPTTQNVGQALSDLLVGYGQTAPVFQVHSFGMSVDPAAIALACDFRIERRASVPYDRELYFSQAPLKTKDHISILEEFNRTMAGSIGLPV